MLQRQNGRQNSSQRFCLLSIFRSNDGKTNRLVQVDKLFHMMNEVFPKHREHSPTCDGFISWDLSREEKRGLGWREMAVCSKCNYESKMYTLYEEIETSRPGRRAACVNQSVQIGLSQSSIGNAGFRRILMTNTPAPSTSGMQKSANKVSTAIQEENIKDMRGIQNELKMINKLRGDPENTVDLEGDGMYNNEKYGGVGKTPYSNSTQAYYTQAENVTKGKKIVNVVIKNKICSYGHFHTSDKEALNCKCTANISQQTSIGDEKRWARESLLELKHNSDLEVKHLTTDPDTASYRVAAELYEKGTTQTEPENLIDTRHLGENHRKYMKKSSVLTDIMPGRTKAMRQKARNNFAIDLSKRCTAEYNAAFKKHSGNVAQIIRGTAFAGGAIVNCYKGDHSRCQKLSYVCKGGQENWVQKSPFLADDFKVKLASSTNPLLRTLINYRLGRQTILKTKLNSNTQKVESVNRRIRRSLPKNVTYARNVFGRCHSAVHSSNYGPGGSLVRLCAGTTMPHSFWIKGSPSTTK